MVNKKNEEAADNLELEITKMFGKYGHDEVLDGLETLGSVN